MKHVLKFKDFFLEQTRAPRVDLVKRAEQYIDVYGDDERRDKQMTLKDIGEELFRLTGEEDTGFLDTNTISRIQKAIGDEPRRDYSSRTRIVQPKGFYPEGTLQSRLVRVGDRDDNVRKDKLASFGNNPITCNVCGFNPLDDKWQSTDPPIYPGITQENSKSMFDVHHIKAIGDGERYTDPIKDTIVVCGNCHAMEDKLQ
jgi:predicted HNH restriction endonuclease